MMSTKKKSNSFTKGKIDPRFVQEDLEDEPQSSNEEELEQDEELGSSIESGEEEDEEAEEAGEYDIDDEDMEGIEFDWPGMEKKKTLAEILEDASNQKSNNPRSTTTEDGRQMITGKGVVYINRVPPGMKPSQLRALLQPLGDVERIWIEVPEHISNDKALSKARAEKKARKSGREAWVEFTKAKRAYKAAKLLNTQAMGTGRWKGDLWSIKYLRDFSWNDLVTQHLHKKKMREQRLRQSLSRAKHEASHFMANRDKQEQIEHRNKKKKRPHPDSGTSDSSKHGTTDEEPIRVRNFTQDKPMAKPTAQSLLDNNLLMKLMGGSKARTEGEPPANKKAKLDKSCTKVSIN